MPLKLAFMVPVRLCVGDPCMVFNVCAVFLSIVFAVFLLTVPWHKFGFSALLLLFTWISC